MDQDARVFPLHGNTNPLFQTHAVVGSLNDLSAILSGEKASEFITEEIALQNLVIEISDKAEKSNEDYANLAMRYTEAQEELTRAKADIVAVQAKSDSSAVALDAAKDQNLQNQHQLRQAQVTINNLEQKINVASTNQDTINDLQTKLSTSASELEVARNRIKTLNEQVAQGQLAQPTVIQQQRSPAYKDPPALGADNKNISASQLEDFLTQLHMKLAANADWYNTEIEKMRYIYSLLRGKALTLVKPYASMGSFINLTSAEDMIALLTGVYSDPDHTNNTFKKLMAMQQGSTPTIQHIAEWQGIAATIGYSDTSDRFGPVYFVNSLNNIVVREMKLTGKFKEFDTITNLAALAKEADGLLKLAYGSDYLKQSSSHIRSAPPAAPTPTPIPTPYIAPPAHAPTPAGEPMELDSSKLSKAWTWTDVHNNRRARTETEKEARRNFCFAEKLCFYCCSPEHDRDNCPKLAALKEKIKKEKKASVSSVEVKTGPENA